MDPLADAPAPTADAIRQLLIPSERPELKTFHMTHRMHIVEANGESYRLRDSQQRIRRKRTEGTET